MHRSIKIFLVIFVITGTGFLIRNYSSLLFSSPQPAIAQTQNTDWTQFQHDAQHTGRTTVSVTPNYKITWAWADKNHIVKNFTSPAGKNITDGFEQGFQYTVMFSGQMQPIIAGGKTYFGAMNGIMYAVDALTGDNKWDYATAGPILASAGYDNGVLVFGSMDGRIYGLDADTGTYKWDYPTGAGINTPPVIANGVAYLGSRDGKMYAVNTSTGALVWSYATKVYPDDVNSPFNSSPIVAPPVLSEDGQTLLFGAENMFFYALNTTNGQHKWNPKKLIGQSFLYGWPVVKGDKVITQTMSSLPGVEFLMESVLDGLPDGVAWDQEETAILNWLNQNPHQKSMYVFDIATGNEPFQVAMGRVTGQNYTAHSPVVDNQNRLLTYWRTRDAYFFADVACFGTKYCPDFSAMDLTTGDRIRLTNSSGNKLAPELDNGFQPTIGGNYVYFSNHFRGTHAINLTNGTLTRLTTQSAKWDCGDFRAWGFQIIYFGNDTEPDCTSNNAKPQSAYNNSTGFAGIAIATTNGRSLLYVNEGDVGIIVAIEGQ